MGTQDELWASWTCAVDVADITSRSASAHAYTTPKLHRAIFADFDIPLHVQVQPYRLVLKPAFMAGLKRRLRNDPAFSLGRHIEAIDLVGGLTLRDPRLTLDLYPAGFLLIQVSGLVTGASPKNTEELRACRRISGSALSRLIESTIGMVSGEAEGNLRKVVREGFVFDWSLSTEIEDFQSRLDSLVATAISTLVGAPARALSTALIDSVTNSCAKLNTKSSRDTLYLNGQGSVRLHAPQHDGDLVYRNRAERLAGQWELALFCHAVLTRRLPHLALPRLSTVFIAKRLQMWLSSFGTLYPSSMVHRLQWERLVEALELNGASGRWREVESTTVGPESARELLSIEEDPWQLPGFPESLDGTTSAQMSFVFDPALADIIAADAAEARRSLATSNYRAAVVFAGAAVEGILLALALGQASASSTIPGLSPKPGYQELLYKICPDAAEKPAKRAPNSSSGRVGKNLISTSTAVLLDQVCRPWRNFIHAKLAVSGTNPPGIQEATIAVMGLDRLIEEAELAEKSGFAYDKA